MPTEFSLSQNYPNPFNSSSIIKYYIPKSSYVTIKIFNTLGEEIETLVNKEKPAGNYKVNWNAVNFRVESTSTNYKLEIMLKLKR